MRIEYTAKRKLATGHTANEEYIIAMGAAKLQKSMKTSRQGNKSIDGSERYLLNHIQYRWKVTTVSVDPGQDLEDFEEFLASVAGGEVFSLDTEGTSSEVNPIAVRLDSTSVTRSLHAPGVGQESTEQQFYRFSFTCLEV